MRQDRVIAGTLAKWSVVTLFFSLSSSRALFSLAGILVFIGLIFEGQWRTKWDILKTNKPALAIIAMVIWFYLSIFWTHANSKDLTNAAQTHWKLLLIPAIVVLIQDEHWKNRCWQGFAAGMVILLAHVYALSWGIDSLTWTSGIPDRVFFNPLPQAVGLGIFCAWCLKEFFSPNKKIKKISFIFVFITASYVVLHISQQRLGYLAWACGCLTVILLTLKNNQRVFGVLILLSLLTIIFVTSTKIQDRFGLIFLELYNYSFENNQTSIGSRLHMWYGSMHAIMQAPFFGHGLGSYHSLANAFFNDAIMCTVGCRHPHNQYLFYSVEFGVIGFGVFLWMLYQVFAIKNYNDVFPKIILLIFVISSTVESPLWYRGFLYLFIPLLAISMININAQHTK